MTLHGLYYDRDWGDRHPRRPELVWYFDKRLNKEQTLRFLKMHSCHNEKAFVWRKEVIQVRSEILKVFKEQDKNAGLRSSTTEYGSTSRSGPILRR